MVGARKEKNGRYQNVKIFTVTLFLVSASMPRDSNYRAARSGTVRLNIAESRGDILMKKQLQAPKATCERIKLDC